MAVEVTRMIASRGFKIRGSATVSTRTSCLPCQVSARIELLQKVTGDRSCSGCRVRRCRSRHLPCLHQLFETAQIAPDLNVRFLLEELREQPACITSRRVVHKDRGHDSTASVGGVFKLHTPGIADVCALG